jgi:hypothetical protein
MKNFNNSRLSINLDNNNNNNSNNKDGVIPSSTSIWMQSPVMYAGSFLATGVTVDRGTLPAIPY